MERPIFFDPTGKRKAWTVRGVGALILAIALVAAIFASTLVLVPHQLDLPLEWGHARPATLKSQISHGVRSVKHWLPRTAAKAPGAPLTLGFYVPWDEASAVSLRQHLAAIDWVVPALVSIAGPQHRLTIVADPKLDRILAAAPHAPKVLPMVQNLSDGAWDSTNTAALLHDRKASQQLAAKLAEQVASRHQAGLVMDFESLPARAIPDYLAFLKQLNDRLPAGASFAVTVPADDASWPLANFAAVADHVILMNYDQHWQGGTPGPIAAQDWFVTNLRNAVKTVGRDHLIVALGSYAYDWHDGHADALSVEEAWMNAHDSGATVDFDRASGNAGFAYDDGATHHETWLLDAAADWNQLRAAQAFGVNGIALWRLGSEDPGVWTDFAAFRGGTRPDIARMRTASNVDVEGSGEILRITAQPTAGLRHLSFDDAGLIRDERYAVLPTPYVVNRTGARDKLIALTFDDGPDPDWTPRILSILEQAHVPATFFVVGENALEHPGLLNRIVGDGDELGNHTYTHPNLAVTGPQSTDLELNATQRLVEAYTGRAMRLFRAPYFGDAEPTTADEIDPALRAQQQGYVVVGLHADPADWKRPGTDAIVDQAIAQVTAATPDRSANVVLLHDGGGDRSQTVAALPRIIAGLQARGYRFVPVSTLAGLSHAQVMPEIQGKDLLAVRADVAIFIALAGLSVAFKWLFFTAIVLGIGRAMLIAGLALFQRSRDRGARPVHTTTVSVIIPAFNEAKVIEASIRRVLASDYPALDLIVVDDGSKDATSAIVSAAFADDPRVTLLTLANGGKARALNRALAIAEGEVIIALDADTHFEVETIRRLARWFADPEIGAVAGNAKVGNRVNLVTRWQAVEYVTAQNLERRALAGFDAITVVPGAVGAWRRSALDAVGGYPVDTLAEDQDLTIAIQRAGWRVTYDADAVAWTEAPETFKALAKQRYRWAFGTLQCLWKHRAVLRERKPAGLALIGLPQAWLFQIVFAAISPMIDLALVFSAASTALKVHQHGWAQTQTDVLQMALYWLVFTGIDIACGWVAYRLDVRRGRYPALLLVAQRFVYRQIMYWVVLRALSSAVAGLGVGWGKLERSGSVETKGTVGVPAS